MATYREVLTSAQDKLQGVGIFEAASDARILFFSTFEIDNTFYLIHGNEQAPAEKILVFTEKLGKRLRHVPVQYIEHQAPFMGYDFYVDENVLIPRMDTEILVDTALRIIEKNSSSNQKTVRVLDMCTGSGCIAISLYLQLSSKNIKVKMDAADISEGALSVARKNASSLCADVSCIHSDLFDTIKDKYDYILSNPPYIRPEVIETLEPEVRCHEPRLALEGFSDGLYFYREITRAAANQLTEGGYLMYEIGYDQGEDVSGIMSSFGFKEVRIIKDLAGLDRVVLGHI